MIAELQLGGITRDTDCRILKRWNGEFIRIAQLIERLLDIAVNKTASTARCRPQPSIGK